MHNLEFPNKRSRLSIGSRRSTMKYLISVAVRPRARALAALLICTTFASRAFGSTNEMGFTYRYETAKSPVNYFSNHELQLTYVRPFSFLWAGFDLKYGNNHSANNIHSSIFEIGGLAKYWIVDPGPSVGFNIFSGLAIGKENTGTEISAASRVVSARAVSNAGKKCTYGFFVALVQMPKRATLTSAPAWL